MRVRIEPGFGGAQVAVTDFFALPGVPRDGCFPVRITAAGRVQTPTLTILARRERDIQAFKPSPYAEVHADFAVTAGTYPGRWIDLNWKKDEANPHGRAERIWVVPSHGMRSRVTAAAASAACS